jgi:1,4-alpha-glucan branching enzyme
MVSLNEAGRCVFRMYMPHAGSVALLGSFCNWELDDSASALELTQDEEGWWTARLSLPAGDHEFCYLVDGRTWMPDYAAAGVRRDSNGRWVSLINVPGRRESNDRPIGALAEPRIGRLPEREPTRALAHAS